MSYLRYSNAGRNRGSILPLVVMVIVILILLGIGLLTVAYGMRLRAIRFKNQTAAMLAAEAGYEQAIFWMNKQPDVLTGLGTNAPGSSGTLSFDDSSYAYSVQFHSWTGGMPVYRVVSTGTCADTQRVVDVLVVQKISGWDMGMCRIPSGPSSTIPVYFANGEIVDIPVHINKYNDSPDVKDIWIQGSPQFRERVEMGESQRTTGGTNKYASVMNLFNGGIYFDQPDVRITDETVVQAKVDRFKNTTAGAYQFTTASNQAAQLEFFVNGGVGYVRVTPNCTVQTNLPGGRDYKIVPGSNGTQFQAYPIYDYHSTSGPLPAPIPITDTYVTQSFAGQQSEPGGQIYVNGDVIIGGDDTTYDPLGQQVVMGKVTVVASGNIWIGDSIVVAGDHDAVTGMPALNNPNVLGLIAQGVIKVVNPTSDSSPSVPSGNVYRPIGIPGSSGRLLPDPTVIEAAVTVGGGGWGAEHVAVTAGGSGRNEFSSPQDDLILRGTICEAVRGVVGLIGQDGYLKHYYLDQRLLQGILPGNIWFSGKYVPAPAGWHDYQPISGP